MCLADRLSKMSLFLVETSRVRPIRPLFRSHPEFIPPKLSLSLVNRPIGLQLPEAIAGQEVAAEILEKRDIRALALSFLRSGVGMSGSELSAVVVNRIVLTSRIRNLGTKLLDPQVLTSPVEYFSGLNKSCEFSLGGFP